MRNGGTVSLKFSRSRMSNKRRHRNVTLTCHCSTDEAQCHWRVLKLVLPSNPPKSKIDPSRVFYSFQPLPPSNS
jgi:hypothetical protein